MPLSTPAPLAVAHRCGPVYGPENLISTAVKAVKQVRAVEIDVRISKTGTPWVMHDWAVNRTTNKTGGVIEMTDKQLLTCIADGTGGKERIPTLYELLKAVKAARPSTQFYIHFQPGSFTASGVKAVQDRVDWLELNNQVVYTSWLPEHLRAFKEHANPNIPRVQHLRVGEPLRRSPWQTGCMPPTSSLTAETVAAARLDGNEIYGSGGPGDWQRLVDFGAKCNMTDNPGPYWTWLGRRADGTL